MEKSSDDYKGSRKVADTRSYERSNWWEHDSTFSYLPQSQTAQVQSYSPGVNSSAPGFKSWQDTLLNGLQDSTGTIDLSRYRVQLSLPFVLGNKIDRIVISSSDTTGRKTDYVIHRVPTDTTAEKDSASLPALSDEESKTVWTVKERRMQHYLGLKIFSGLKYSSKYANITGVSIIWGFHYDERRRLALHLGAAILPQRENSDLLGSIGDIYQVHLGYQHRLYFTEDDSFLGVFLPVDGVIKSVFWRYKNPVTSDVYAEGGEFLYTEKIKGDGLWGFSLGTGIGISLVQTRALCLTGEATGGGTLYWVKTHKGFTNDVFAGDLFLMFSVEVAFGIR
jgi:hypothetical protein